MSGVPRRDRDWAICVLGRWTATWPVGKISRKKKEGADLLFGGEPCRLDRGQRLARGIPSRARFQFLPLHPSPLTRRISPRHRIARLCMRHVISVRNPDAWTPWPIGSTFSSPHDHRPWSPRSNWRTVLGVSLLILLWSSPLTSESLFLVSEYSFPQEK